MILTVLELIAMLAVLGLAFVLGRMWEIRQQEIGGIMKGTASGYRRRTFPSIRLPSVHRC